MRILFIAHRIPYPPDKGDKLRAFNILKYLSEKHEISLVSLYDVKSDAQHISALKEFCKEIYLYYADPFLAKVRGAMNLLLNKPITNGYFYSAAMKNKIIELLGTKKFDIVFGYSSSMAQYMMDAGIKKIMDFVDCDSAKWKQYASCAAFPMSLIYAREYTLLRAYEKKTVDRFDRLLVVTDAEKKEFSAFADISKFTVLQNGVDTGFFKQISPSDGKALVFTGAMDYFANIDGVSFFCKSVFPLIKKGCPDAEFYIVGHRPTHEVKKLSEISGVFVTGSVADTREYLRKAAVAVIPLRIAQGVQNKILEAMSSGLPVITTSKACGGLVAQPGKDLIVADEPEDFAAKVLELLNDGTLRKRMGDNARRYVEENHNWTKNLSKLDEALK